MLVETVGSRSLLKVGKMTKTILLTGLVGASLMTAPMAFAADTSYYGVSDAVFYKKQTEQIFNIGEVRLTHNKDNEKYSDSSTPIFRDYFSLNAYQNGTKALTGTVETTSAIQGFQLYTGGSKSYTIATADSISSTATSAQASGASTGGATSASSQFVNLRILGQPYTPSGAPNEKFIFTVANYGTVKIIFNSEKVFGDGRISHSAVRVSLPNGEQYFLAHVAAGVVPKSNTP